MTPMNQEIAQKLRNRAAELATNGDNLYRVRAFRHAAMAVLSLTKDVTALVAADGSRALERVPGIGKSLAITITQFVETETRTVAA